MYNESSEEQGAGAIIPIIMSGAPLLMFPLWSFIFLLKNKDKLQTEEFKQKYSALYSDL